MKVEIKPMMGGGYIARFPEGQESLGWSFLKGLERVKEVFAWALEHGYSVELLG